MHRHAVSELEPSMFPVPLLHPRSWPRPRGRTAMGMVALLTRYLPALGRL